MRMRIRNHTVNQVDLAYSECRNECVHLFNRDSMTILAISLFAFAVNPMTFGPARPPTHDYNWHFICLFVHLFMSCQMLRQPLPVEVRSRESDVQHKTGRMSILNVNIARTIAGRRAELDRMISNRFWEFEIENKLRMLRIV